MANRTSRNAVIAGLVVAGCAAAGIFFVSGQGGSSLEQNAKLKAAEVLGQAARRALAADSQGLEGTHGSSANLIDREIEIRQLTDDIYLAIGVGNVTMITTPEGNVVYDTGLVIQAAEQRKLLREQASDGPVTHVILSHSHGDHAGGVKVWMDEGVEIIAHREFEEELRYLGELERFQHRRNRQFFPFMPDEPPNLGFLDWHDVVPTITVDDGQVYTFELGGKTFQVLGTPGAEGADNICLWLPDEKVLVTGDFFGPQFPQFPNIVTLRGEKVRKPIEYIRSLERIIALEPEMIIPSHFNPTVGRDEIMAGLVKMRDAVRYVHDETVAAMNEGKTVYEAMREIQLPPELELAQNHGPVSWGVKTIWEYYGSWFHWDTTTEMYPVPARDVYGDVAELAGEAALVERADRHLAAGRPVEALHLVEMALGNDPNYAPALEVRKRALLALKQRALDGHRVDYELNYLDHRLADTERRLADSG